MQLIECIPNFSEGRNQKVINSIVKAITSISGVIILDQESDKNHNRSVITFAGEPEKVIKAAFQATKKAAELIDLNKHRGEHPRMGATDVIPLVPLKGISEKECIAYAKKLAKSIGKELQIPVYLYEKAATSAERENLANIRQGEYETIKKEIAKNPKRTPDFGPKKLGKAGVTAVGVRPPLIAYNVNLASKDINIAKAIAKKIREKNGGLKCVKALGFSLEDKGMVQVSMNLTNYKETPPCVVFAAIKKEAKKYGVKIAESEIIGLIPQQALIEDAKNYLKLKNFNDKQILEVILEQKRRELKQNTCQTIIATSSESSSKNLPSSTTLSSFLNILASKNPVPGGGSVSALSGSLAAALASMVANLTLANKKYAKVHKEIAKILQKTEKLRHQLYNLIDEDSQAYQKVIESYQKSKKAKKSANQNNQKIQTSLKQAALVPLKIAQTTSQILDPLKIISQKGNQNAISDCGVALHLAHAAIKSAILNIKINLKYIKDKNFIKKISNKIAKIENIVFQHIPNQSLSVALAVSNSS